MVVKRLGSQPCSKKPAGISVPYSFWSLGLIAHGSMCLEHSCFSSSLQLWHPTTHTIPISALTMWTFNCSCTFYLPLQHLADSIYLIHQKPLPNPFSSLGLFIIQLNLTNMHWAR